MTSHVIDLIWSEQFQIITDPASQGCLNHQSLDYLIFQINLSTFGSTFQINLSNQPFKSTFWLNLRNQLSYWIGGATSLWYIDSSDKRTYVGECSYLLR